MCTNMPVNTVQGFRPATTSARNIERALTKSSWPYSVQNRHEYVRQERARLGTSGLWPRRRLQAATSSVHECSSRRAAHWLDPGPTNEHGDDELATRVVGWSRRAESDRRRNPSTYAMTSSIKSASPSAITVAAAVFSAHFRISANCCLASASQLNA